MTLFPLLSFRDLIKRIEKLGFVPVRQRGSHIRFIHSDGRKTTLPDPCSRGELSILERYRIEKHALPEPHKTQKRR